MNELVFETEVYNQVEDPVIIGKNFCCKMLTKYQKLSFVASIMVVLTFVHTAEGQSEGNSTFAKVLNFLI